jgi:hypothetical protein
MGFVLWNTWKFAFNLGGQSSTISKIFAAAVSGRTEAMCNKGQQNDPVHQIALPQKVLQHSIRGICGTRISNKLSVILVSPSVTSCESWHAVTVNNLTNSIETMRHNVKFNPLKNIYYFKKFSILSTLLWLLFSYNSKNVSLKTAVWLAFIFDMPCVLCEVWI